MWFIAQRLSVDNEIGWSFRNLQFIFISFLINTQKLLHADLSDIHFISSMSHGTSILILQSKNTFCIDNFSQGETHPELFPNIYFVHGAYKLIFNHIPKTH